MKNLAMLSIAVLMQCLAPLLGQTFEQRTLIGSKIKNGKLYYFFENVKDSVPCGDTAISCLSYKTTTRPVEIYTIDTNLKGFEKSNYEKLSYLYQYRQMKCPNGVSNENNGNLTPDAIVTEYFNRKYLNWEPPSKSSKLLFYKNHYSKFTPILNKVDGKVTALKVNGYRWYLNVHVISFFFMSLMIYLGLCAYRVTHKINFQVLEETGKSRLRNFYIASMVIGIIGLLIPLSTLIGYISVDVNGNKSFLIDSYYTYLTYYLVTLLIFLAQIKLKKVYTEKFTPKLSLTFVLLFISMCSMFMMKIQKESGTENMGYFLLYEAVILLFLIPRSIDKTIVGLLSDLHSEIDLYFLKKKTKT